MAERTTPPTPRKKKPGPAPRTDWYDTFLEALAKTPVVSYACEEAGISRDAAYDARQRDETFALRWAEAHEAGLDSLERVAFARARQGQPVTKTTRKFDKDGKLLEETVVEERQISNSLLMFILKKNRPEYRDTFKVENTGPGGGPIKVERVDSAVDELFAELDRLRDD